MVRRIGVVPAGFLLLLIPIALSAAAEQDPLWSKAVGLARRSKPWMPGTTVMQLELLDDKGASTESFETLMRISPDTAGNPVTEVEKATHNGSDVTASQREAQEKRNRDAAKSGKPAPFMLGDNPFDPDVQSVVQVEVLGRTALVSGVTCAMYKFSWKKTDGAEVSGTAALETKTGAPREVEYTLKPLPAGVWSMKTVLRYGDGPEGGGYLREVFIEGTGGVLFIKKSFRTLITLDAYWKNGKD
jgi:hypothetical protein